MSVPGMLLIHCERVFVGQIARSGLTFTNWQPRAHARAMAPRSTCWLDAAAGHHAVLQRHATEGDHDVTMVSDLLPGQIALRQLLIVADDVRQQDRGGARTI